MLFLCLEKYLERKYTTEEITGLSHDQVALFKTFHGTLSKVVQGRQSTCVCKALKSLNWYCLPWTPQSEPQILL